MALSKTDVIIVNDDRDIFRLNDIADTHQEFETVESIKNYLQKNAEIGEYDIFTVDSTVTVTPEAKIFAGYSNKDVEMVYEAEKLKSKEGVINVSIADDPMGENKRIFYNGVEVSVSPYEYDVEVYIKIGDEYADLDEEIKNELSGLWKIGNRVKTYHESRGSRGIPAMKVYFKRFIYPIRNAIETAENMGLKNIRIFSEEAVSSYYNRINRVQDLNAIILTDVRVSNIESGIYPFENTIEGGANLIDYYNTESKEYIEKLQDRGWELSSLGTVTSQESGDFLLAIGVHNEDLNIFERKD